MLRRASGKPPKPSMVVFCRYPVVVLIARGGCRGCCCRVPCFCSLGVFAVLSFGSGSVCVVASVGSVAAWCRRLAFWFPSRSAAASWLWRLRAVRRSWRRVPVPGSSAWLRGGFAFPRVGSLRWLGAFWLVLCVRGVGVGGRRRSAWVCRVPPGRWVRG